MPNNSGVIVFVSQLKLKLHTTELGTQIFSKFIPLQIIKNLFWDEFEQDLKNLEAIRHHPLQTEETF